MFLVERMAGGFNHLYVDAVEKSESQCRKDQANRFLSEGVLKIEYKDNPNYGNGLYSFTQKGIKYYKKHVKGE